MLLTTDLRGTSCATYTKIYFLILFQDNPDAAANLGYHSAFSMQLNMWLTRHIAIML